MEKNRVAVVTDSCSSLRPENSLVKDLGINILPITINFFKDKEIISYKDLEISFDEFYQKMADSQKVPQTSGILRNDALTLYKKLAQTSDSIISIHISKKMSEASFEGVSAAKTEILTQRPELVIEIIDSQQLSFGEALLVEEAARLSQQGAKIEEIKTKVLDLIPQIQVFAAFSNLKNLTQSDRIGTRIAAFAGSLLSIYPYFDVEEGSIVPLGAARSFKKAMTNIVEKIGDEKQLGKPTKMVVVHTNDEEAAKELVTKLSKIYQGQIPIYEAGQVIGVHGGQGGVGVAVLRQ